RAGPGRPPVGGAGIDFIAPRQGRAPEIVIKGAGKMVGAGGTVAFRAIVGVVEVELLLVAAEAAVFLTLDGGVVVDPGQDRLVIAALDQRRPPTPLSALSPPVRPPPLALL